LNLIKEYVKFLYHLLDDIIMWGGSKFT